MLPAFETASNHQYTDLLFLRKAALSTAFPAVLGLSYVSDHRTGHPGYPAVQLRLTSHQ